MVSGEMEFSRESQAGREKLKSGSATEEASLPEENILRSGLSDHPAGRTGVQPMMSQRCNPGPELLSYAHFLTFYSNLNLGAGEMAQPLRAELRFLSQHTPERALTTYPVTGHSTRSSDF